RGRLGRVQSARRRGFNSWRGPRRRLDPRAHQCQQPPEAAYAVGVRHHRRCDLGGRDCRRDGEAHRRFSAGATWRVAARLLHYARAGLRWFQIGRVPQRSIGAIMTLMRRGLVATLTLGAALLVTLRLAPAGGDKDRGKKFVPDEVFKTLVEREAKIIQQDL